MEDIVYEILACWPGPKYGRDAKLEFRELDEPDVLMRRGGPIRSDLLKLRRLTFIERCKIAWRYLIDKDLNVGNNLTPTLIIAKPKRQTD